MTYPANDRWGQRRIDTFQKRTVSGTGFLCWALRCPARSPTRVRRLAAGHRLAIDPREPVRLSNSTPPDLVLNRHCGECDFQARCRKIAVEKDDLSLLAGMSAKERQKLRSKGIFTVTQLSYTFRARRRCKRWKSQQPGYSHALKALAIREKKTHVIGRPTIELDGTPVYLDVEGTDDGLYYLIGCRVNAQQRSFWAEDRLHERTAFEDFLNFLASVPNPKLIFYGRYERRFLTEMSQRYDDLFVRFPAIENIVQKSLNMISAVYGKIYFPTYGNTLKDLARHLGFAWTSAGASGLQSLVWRAEWEASKDDHLMRTLLKYPTRPPSCESRARRRVQHRPRAASDGPRSDTSRFRPRGLSNRPTR